MMNILARILSHGFAIGVVVILAVVFIYRGELFPGTELPAFLYPGKPTQTEGEVPAGDVERVEPAAEIARPAVVDDAETAQEEPQVEIAAVEPPAETAPVEAPAEAAVEAEAPTEAAPMEAPAEVAVEEPPAEAAVEAPAEVAVEKPPAEAAVEAPAEVAVEEPPAEAAVEAPAEVAVEEPPAETAEEAPAEVAVEEPPAEAVVEEPQVETAALEAPAEAAAVEPQAETVPQAAVESAVIAPAESMQPVEGAQDTVSPATDDSAAEVVATISPPEKAAAAVSQGVETQIQPAGTANPYQLLAAAREAFWRHDYANADKNYRDLIALEPDNPDGYGELGTMYFAQGKWEQAAEAYYDAGTRLVVEGRIQQAEVLVQVIRGLNGNQADELAEQIAAARTANTGTR
ncbi:MAG: hypothetical protein JSU75_00280 [Gammaproteobacteria bacterium]|nr:MAG: hypothetical protein JSU75_00280 [Gammaproteobacteria bacterium]